MHRPHRFYTALTLTGLLAAGCASPYRAALSPGAAGSLGEASGVVAVEQHEIGTTINPSRGASMALGGGLIGALIDSAANSHSAGKMEKFAADLRQAMLDYKFEDVAGEALTARFSAGENLALSKVVVVRDRNEPDLAKIVQEGEGDAVLVLFVRYFLNPEFTRVVVTSEAVVCAKSPELRKLATLRSYGGTQVPVLYRNGFQSSWSLPASQFPEDARRESLAPVWAQDNAALARQALANAAAETGAMLEWDFAQPAAENYKPASGKSATVMSYAGTATLPMRGAMVKTEGSRWWVRLVDGRMVGEPL